MTTNTVAFDDAELMRFINALPRSIFDARKSAVQAAMGYAKQQLNSQMATKTGIPSRVFRRFRIKTKRIQDGATVWMGVNRVKATYVGKLSNFGSGAYAGHYYFEGGFVAKMQSGHIGIFKRRGEKRLHIDEQYVDINIGFKVAEDVADDTRRVLMDAFISRVKQLNPHLT